MENLILHNSQLIFSIFLFLMFSPWRKGIDAGARFIRYAGGAFILMILLQYAFEYRFIPRNTLQLFLNDPNTVEIGRNYFSLLAITSLLVSTFPSLGTQSRSASRIKIQFPAKRQVLLLSISIALLIINILFKSFHLLYSRNDYLPKQWSGNFVSNIVQYASFISILSLFLLNFERRKSLTFFKWFLVFAWQLYFLALASRASISIALIFLIAYSVRGESIKLFKRILLGLYIFTIYSLALIIRGQEKFGLKHILEAINPQALLSSTSLQMVQENIVSPVGILGLTNQTAVANYSNLITAINPLPGRWTNWYEIAPSLRINSFIPYSGFGEISTLGPVGFVLISFGLFWVIRLSINFTEQEDRLNGSLTTVVMLIFGAFLFLMLQYNLRSCIRIFEVGVILTLSLFLSGRRSKTSVKLQTN